MNLSWLKLSYKMEMKLFFEKISTEIENAVKKDINKILKEIGEERVCAIAFVTDSDCIILYLAINTYEYMNKKDHEYIELLQDKLSEEYIKKSKGGFLQYHKMESGWMGIFGWKQ